MSSGTAGAAGCASAAGFSGGASPQPARKQAARIPSAAFRQVRRRTARFLVISLPVPEGKDGKAAGSLAGVRKQSLSVRFSIIEASLLLFCPPRGEGVNVTILAVARPPRKKSSAQVAFLMRWRSGARRGPRLTPGEDGVQPGLKIFFPLGGQFTALDRKRSLDGLHPIDQSLDVFAGLGVIFLQVAAGGHPLAKRVLEGIVGGPEWVRGCGGSEKAAVPGEEMLESQVGGEMAGGGGDAVVVDRAVADEGERLRLAAPL